MHLKDIHMDIQDGQDNEKDRMKIFIMNKRLTVEYNVKEREQNIRYHLNLCCMPEPTHKAVYYRLGLSGIPSDRSHVAVKCVVTINLGEGPLAKDIFAKLAKLG